MLDVRGIARKGIHKHAHGFTMVELLLVIITVGIISVVALPKFLDFRTEARVATAQNYVNGMRGSLTAKKTQMMLYCNQNADTWPRLEAFLANDITEGGAVGASCTQDQIRDPIARKFFDQDNLFVPENPYNGRSDIVETNETDYCSLSTSDAGYYYNRRTGVLGHPQMMSECTGRLLAGDTTGGGTTGGETTGGESTGGETTGGDTGGTTGDEGGGGGCTPNYQLNGDDLCEDVQCGSGLAERDLCTGGGYQVGDSCSAPGFDNGTWNGSECVGCWSYQTFDGSSCIDPPGCAASGGSWPPGDPTCTCPSGSTWDGSTCAADGGGGETPYLSGTCTCENGTVTLNVDSCGNMSGANFSARNVESGNPSEVMGGFGCNAPQSFTYAIQTSCPSSLSIIAYSDAIGSVSCTNNDGGGGGSLTADININSVDCNSGCGSGYGCNLSFSGSCSIDGQPVYVCTHDYASGDALNCSSFTCSGGSYSGTQAGSQTNTGVEVWRERGTSDQAMITSTSFSATCGGGGGGCGSYSFRGSYSWDGNSCYELQQDDCGSTQNGSSVDACSNCGQNCGCIPNEQSYADSWNNDCTCSGRRGDGCSPVNYENVSTSLCEASFGACPYGGGGGGPAPGCSFIGNGYMLDGDTDTCYTDNTCSVPIASEGEYNWETGQSYSTSGGYCTWVSGPPPPTIHSVSCAYEEQGSILGWYIHLTCSGNSSPVNINGISSVGTCSNNSELILSTGVVAGSNSLEIQNGPSVSVECQ
jgi:type II secretory pathway pseudopilin PulG